jgi:glycerophosphoryl diester phosphodiesterase
MGLISAHRGGPGSAHAPANSLAAFQHAVRLKCDLIEFDVRHHRDGSPYVAHEPTGDVEALALRSVVDVIAGHAIAHVDLKDTGHEIATVEWLVGRLGAANMIVTSAEDSSVRTLAAWAQDHAPQLLVGLSSARRTWTGPTWARSVTALHAAFAARRIRRSGATLIAAHQRHAAWSLRRYAKRRGLPLLVWTVDTPRELERWVNDPDTWAVVTNVPHVAQQVRTR